MIKGVYNAEDYEKPSLMDKFEYVMYGKVFKVEEKKEKKEYRI
jgi:RNA polymerase Rpb8.